ncbi:patatin-like phospholipase family protein [Kineococcus gynurae]|uniref:Patatin-like phospholipase family protein n=1 Tax=Kineococcus gynurae TaxID=452979 RepID=A0ABV5LQJ1_9ACTN
MSGPRRSLVLAGGGMKVAAQAGALQVLLDEAGLEFEHADGTSGGVLNLLLWAQGFSGRRIADVWRRHRPLATLSVSPAALLGPLGTSVLTLGALRRVVRGWGVDLAALQHEAPGTRARAATVTLLDVGAQRAVSRVLADLSEEEVFAALALPVFFPPVRHRGRLLADAVWATDANLFAGIDRGAEELWVVWTVSGRGDWGRGWVGGYFAALEAAATTRLEADLARIERNNAAVRSGAGGEFGREIRVHVLRLEVPVHYLFTVRAGAFPSAVEQGVREARAWCRDLGLLDRPAAAVLPPAVRRGAMLEFAEVMSGSIAFAGSPQRFPLSLHLDVTVPDVDAWVRDEQHPVELRGTVRCEALGGERPVHRGRIRLLHPVTGPDGRRRLGMTYEIDLADLTGRLLHLHGHKTIRDDPGPDLWDDTTRLAVTLRSGRRDDPEPGPTTAAGELRLTPGAFLRILSSFRPRGAPRDAATALPRFVRTFLGELAAEYLPPTPRERGVRLSGRRGRARAASGG